MLKKFVSDTGRDWDKWLPCLLLAYREVPQSTTGFSPFELMYGWPVPGSLNMLRESWKANPTASTSTSVSSYVLQMREKLERMTVCPAECGQCSKTKSDGATSPPGRGP